MIPVAVSVRIRPFKVAAPVSLAPFPIVKASRASVLPIPSATRIVPLFVSRSRLFPAASAPLMEPLIEMLSPAVVV